MKIILLIAMIPLLYPVKSQDKEKIEYQEITIKCIQSTLEEQLILSDTDYQKLLEKRSLHPDCDTYDLPEIDFDKHSLIGIHYGVAGCENPDVEINVYSLPDGTYQVKTEITQIGLCKRLNHVKKWILIPRIDDPEKIGFDKTVTVNRE
ncbi:MAG: hypothetical protein ACLFM1_04245 [Bacteroidales bacterium]